MPENMNQETATETQAVGEWQACPVCGGRKSMPMGFYPGQAMATNTAESQCRTCTGLGVIVRPGSIRPIIADHDRAALLSEALAALRKYGRHFSPGCDVNISRNQAPELRRECTCGYDAAIARLTPPATQSKPWPVYDKDFGDKTRCRCNHAYFRHFDTYDAMRPVGCKHCRCHEFEVLTPPATQDGK